MKRDLIEILKIQSYSGKQFRMFAYLIRQLKAMGCDYYTYNGCIYATKGQADIYPCVVSHMDTVHKIVEDLQVMEIGDNLTGFNRVKMEQTGIGGDDKVGIYIALECLKTFDNLKVVFFRDEETGCNGSYEPDLSFFVDCGFVLQCDRRGYGDFVTNASGTKLAGKRFKKDVKKIISGYGYDFVQGAMTDVMALKESGIDCAMANMSCGYYNPHSSKEYVNYPDVAYCLDMVKDIIKTMGGTYYSSPYVAAPAYIGSKWTADWRKVDSKTGKPSYDWDAEDKKYRGWADEYKYNTSKVTTNYTDHWGNPAYDPFLDDPKDVKTFRQTCDSCLEFGETQYFAPYNIDMCAKCIRDHVTA